MVIIMMKIYDDQKVRWKAKKAEHKTLYIV